MNENLDLFKGYKKLKSMPEDPENSVVYGKITDNAECMVFVFPIPQDNSILSLSEEKIIQDINENISDNEVLIEVEKDTSKSCFYTVIKTQLKPDGVAYVLSLDIKGSNNVIYHIRGTFVERGMTGVRDSIIFELLQKKNKIDKNHFEKWTFNPYSNNKQGAMMNLSEKEEYDKLFPTHPLSELRKFVKFIKNNDWMKTLEIDNETIETNKKKENRLYIYGVDCSYGKFFNTLIKYFSDYEIAYNDADILINIKGNIVRIYTFKFEDEEFFKKQTYGMCSYFSNSNMKDTKLKKEILKQILAFNSIFSFEYEGTSEIQEIVNTQIFSMANELNSYVLLSPSILLLNKYGKLVIAADNDECEITELTPILPEKFDCFYAERIIRREISNSILYKQNIVCLEELQTIKSSNLVKLKSLDEICKKALASFFIIQLVCDIQNGKCEDSVEKFSKLLKKFNVLDYLNIKEKKILEGTYDKQDLIDIDWEYETYWTLIWALNFVEDISDASDICDCNYAIKIVEECNSYEDFKNKCKLRDVNEILDMVDLYYRYYWACKEKIVNPETSIGRLNSDVVVERRRGLEWIISDTKDWYNISLDV